MKTMTIMIVAGLVLGLATNANTASEINVNVGIKTDGPDKPSSGAGGFWVEEGGYGRVSLTFPKDTGNYRIVSSGAVQGPVTRLTKDEPYIVAEDTDIALMSDIYLRPSVSANGKIKLDGTLINLSRDGKTLLYDYSEEKFDLILANNGRELVKLTKAPSGKDIYLEINAKSNDELIYNPKSSRSAILHTEYSLYNQNKKDYEMQKCRATLGFTDDEENSEGTTSYWKVFDLPGSDSLLYMSSFGISDPKWDDSGSLSFDFDIVHIYSINPDHTPSNSDEIQGEKTTIVTSTKKITIAPGEKTEIEIPPSKNSLLPFSAKETIVLTYEMEKK